MIEGRIAQLNRIVPLQGDTVPKYTLTNLPKIEGFRERITERAPQIKDRHQRIIYGAVASLLRFTPKVYEHYDYESDSVAQSFYLGNSRIYVTPNGVCFTLNRLLERDGHGDVVSSHPFPSMGPAKVNEEILFQNLCETVEPYNRMSREVHHSKSEITVFPGSKETPFITLARTVGDEIRPLGRIDDYQLNGIILSVNAHKARDIQGVMGAIISPHSTSRST